MKYAVRFLMDDTYKVVMLTPNESYNEDDYESMEYDEETVFRGGLADCEAFIRLSEGGYM